MTAPLEFAARLLTRRGALVEASGEAVEAVLSPELGAALHLGEHAVLAEGPAAGSAQVGYGSALLERMLAAATGQVPFAPARVAGVAVRERQARAAAEALSFRNGVFTVGAAVAGVQHRLVAHALYVLHGDERREGLSAAAVSLGTLGVVDGFEELVGGALQAEAAPGPGEARLAEAARRCLSACAGRAARAAVGFQESMERRFLRDRERLEGYFGDLLAELERRAARGRTGTADAGEKRQVLEREREAKLAALSARYLLRVEVRPVALLLVEAPVFRVAVELHRRKASREVELEFDCVTRELVPPACDGCGAPAPRPAACDDAVHLLCEACAPRSTGRATCAACRGRR